MGIDKIQVYKEKEDGKLGLGVKVVDGTATLSELLKAWEPLADDPLVVKKYATEEGACKGCYNNCCNAAFVIPDLVSFKAMCRETGQTPEQFLESALDRSSLAKGIPRLRFSPCLFLRDRICSIYPARSLICRFYLCTELLGDTEELVYSIVTSGISATFIYLENEGLIKSGQGLTGFDTSLLELVEKRREHLGTLQFLKAESYDEIRLELFLP
ncbi:MAG: YkgJ family cysteine cluster protein [Candidatus Saccharibacteria bacterium]